MIEIGDRAREKLEELGVGDGGFVRVRVKTGGCAGMTYDAEVDRVLALDDVVIYDDGSFKVVAEAGSQQYLEGLEIDYSDDLISAGFRFSNPGNQSSCGCGASFGLAGFPEITKGDGCGQ